MKCVGLKKSYNEQVLKDVSIDFDKNGMIFILGKSGSGKSTLLNLLATIDSPTGGEIYDGDMRLDLMSQTEVDSYRKNNIGFVFQDYCLIRDLSVAENIAIGEAYSLVDREKIKVLLQQLELDPAIVDKKASELSGGQQQRVSIARALYKEARIIFADEPTGNLDKENAHKTFEILKRISEKCTVIIVTHDKESAEEFADRIIEISDGKVLRDYTVNSNDKSDIAEPVKRSPRKKMNRALFRGVSRRFEKQGMIRKIVSIIGISLVLCVIGLVLAISKYNFAKFAAPVLKAESTMPSVGISKGYTNTISGDFSFGPRPLDDSDVSAIETAYPNAAKDSCYAVLGAGFASGGTGSHFLKNQILYAVVSEEEHMKMYGFSLDYGLYPKKKNEIAITDYMAYSIYLLNSQAVMDIAGASSKEQLKDEKFIREYIDGLTDKKREDLLGGRSRDEMVDLVVKNPGLLVLNNKLDLTIDSFKVTGIITTGYEKYEDMIYMADEKLYNEERYNEFFYLSNLYCYNLYVTNDFVKNLYSNGLIFFDNAISAKYSKVDDYLNITKKLERNEVLMSSAEFRKRYEQEFDPKKTDEYIVEIESSTSYGKGGPVDVYYDGQDVKVVGVFDLPKDYEALFGIDRVIVFSDEYYDDYAKHQVHLDMIQMSMEDEGFDYYSFIEFLNAHELYFYNYFAASMYNFTPIMSLFKKIFLGIFVVVLFLACYMVVNYFTYIISARKKDIGIMRALGISIHDIRKIFISIAAKIMVIVLMIAFVLYTAGVGVFNKILSKNYLAYILNTNMKKLSIVNNSADTYLFMLLIAAVLLTVSIFLPMRKIAKINAIDVIRK